MAKSHLLVGRSRRGGRKNNERIIGAMRLSTILVLVLASIVILGKQRATNNQSRKIPVPPKQLELSIATDRQRYTKHGKLRLNAMLTNTSYIKDVFVYSPLGWGHLSSLTYTIRDASGKFIEPTILYDELTPPIDQSDTESFVKLRPNQFLGVRFIEGLDRLGIKKPGRYSILVEYHCPISTTDVDRKDFWSKEDGALRSNLVWIEVVR